VGRKPTDDDATKHLRPGDKTQQAEQGTKIGKLRRGEVLSDFRKIVKRQAKS
jgi:hypothetical protein